MSITDIDDCNNIIFSSFTIQDFIAVSRVNKRSYHNIKCNVLYKDIIKLTSKKNITKQICKYGLLSLLIHCKGKKDVNTNNIAYQAVRYGQTNILNWYKSTLKKPMKCNKALTTIASEKGHVVSLDWLYENTKFLFNVNAIIAAITNRHLHIIEWFYAHDLLYNILGYEHTLLWNPKILTWFLDHKIYQPSHKDIITILCRYNTIPLSILHAKGYINDFYKNVIRSYTVRDNLKNIKDITNNKWLKWTKDYGIMYDHNNVQFLIDNDLLHVITILYNNDMLVLGVKDWIKNYIYKHPTSKNIAWSLSNDITFNVNEKLSMCWSIFKYHITVIVIIVVGIGFILT
jgi:hypothetical protein